MTKTESYTVKRVLKAINDAQERLGVRYNIQVEVANESDMADGAIIAISRTGRGLDDASAFNVIVNAKAAWKRSHKELLIDAGHEMLHALLMEMGEAAERCPTWSREKEESVVYQLQRAIFGEAA